MRDCRVQVLLNSQPGAYEITRIGILAVVFFLECALMPAYQFANDYSKIVV
jgi:hypothetical protein